MTAPTTRDRRTTPALIVNTGDGKGKTTAAMGLALRAWAQGWSIGVFQFVKSGRWPAGERAALAELGAAHERSGVGGPVDWIVVGAGRTALRPASDSADPGAEARATWAEAAARLAEERHDLYILDEFTYPLTRGWVDASEVIAALRDRPGHQHVVVTGRGAPPELLAIATNVTRMDNVKHPFADGQRGQAGIEW